MVTFRLIRSTEAFPVLWENVVLNLLEIPCVSLCSFRPAPFISRVVNCHRFTSSPHLTFPHGPMKITSAELPAREKERHGVISFPALSATGAIRVSARSTQCALHRVWKCESSRSNTEAQSRLHVRVTCVKELPMWTGHLGVLKLDIRRYEDGGTEMSAKARPGLSCGLLCKQFYYQLACVDRHVHSIAKVSFYRK